MGRMYDPDAAEAVVWLGGLEWHILKDAREAWALSYGSPIRRTVGDLFAAWLVDRAHTLAYVHRAAGEFQGKRVEVEFRTHPAVWMAILRGANDRGQPYVSVGTGQGVAAVAEGSMKLFGIPVGIGPGYSETDIELVLVVKS